MMSWLACKLIQPTHKYLTLNIKLLNEEWKLFKMKDNINYNIRLLKIQQ